MNISPALLCLILLSANTNYSEEKKYDSVEALFTRYYKTNHWESQESVSGPGSELRFTNRMRQDLSTLIRLFGITSIADAPCGDLNWMRYVDIGTTCRYIGYDI